MSLQVSACRPEKTGQVTTYNFRMLNFLEHGPEVEGHGLDLKFVSLNPLWYALAF